MVSGCIEGIVNKEASLLDLKNCNADSSAAFALATSFSFRLLFFLGALSFSALAGVFSFSPVAFRLTLVPFCSCLFHFATNCSRLLNSISRGVKGKFSFSLLLLNVWQVICSFSVVGGRPFIYLFLFLTAAIN